MVNIFISGDFCPRLRAYQLIHNGQMDLLFGDIIDIIKSCDYAITNLEAPLTNQGKPIPKTGPNLRLPENTIDALVYAGFNMVTLANNHIMDYGFEGLISTINLCVNNNIRVVGAGTNKDEAKTIICKTINNVSFSFINICENEWSTTVNEKPGANPLDEIAVYHQIQDAKNKAKHVILLCHGGHETYGYPSPRMKKLYRWFIDLGVDAVIGNHTHCYSGAEIYKNKPIVYSLGNFIFDHKSFRNTSWNVGCATILKFDNDNVSFELIPFSQCTENIGLKLFDNEQKKQFQEENERKRAIIESDELLEKEFAKFLSNRYICDFMEPCQNRYYLTAVHKNWVPSFINKKKLLLLLNLVRCESHRDVLIKSIIKIISK